MRLERTARWGAFKVCRKAGEFPIASTVVVIDPERGLAAIFLGALPDRPRQLPELSHQLLCRGGKNLTTAVLAGAVAQAAPDLDEIDRRIHVGCLARAIEQALA